MNNIEPIKISRIISAFKEPHPDPKTIAKKFEFTDHKEMARYMKSQGYKWDIEKNNYIEISRTFDEIENDVCKAFIKDSPKNLSEDINEYLPFIQFLYEKKNDIYKLLNAQETGKMPRYALPGIARTKAIYMNDTIAKLIVEFSKEKNITQREIVETALIEYLLKYGYKPEIESILQDR